MSMTAPAIYSIETKDLNLWYGRFQALIQLRATALRAKKPPKAKKDVAEEAVAAR